MLVEATLARALTERVLTAHGVPPDHARTQTDLFIEAELRGLPSHGLLRLRRVIERIEAGLANPSTTGQHNWTKRNFLSVDGEGGLGPVVALSALDTIIARAGEDGIALAAIKNAGHLGALTFYADYAARKGLTLIGFTISEALMHPFGGRDAMLGTNPIAIGVPAEPFPLILDMATSLVSMGKIHDYANRGAPIPEGWALDAAGNPTTDAQAAKSGAIAPFGGAKGYALGLAFEVLVASLAGSAIGTDVKGTLDSTQVCNKGDLFIVIAPQHAQAAKELVSGYLDAVRASSPAMEGEPVRIPGDRAHENREQALAHGLHLDDGLWRDLQALEQESKKISQGVA